ncbi:CASP8-associated protein 2 [Merluccius polli]|uniref:CASP8-associated protein 2 n=1 Tax=Merluccius polli TaxID=89951 RepID=A0AA47P1Q7_MERPO|nr:CASP8-associated protein 2 [Merluccius polli]
MMITSGVVGGGPENRILARILFRGLLSGACCEASESKPVLPMNCGDEDSVDIYSGLGDTPSHAPETPSTLFSPRVKDSMDLYEEILTEEVRSKDSSYEELKARFLAAQSQIEELRKRLAQTETQNTGLSTENMRLKKNISALLKTARQEVLRKDEEIKTLNQSCYTTPPSSNPTSAQQDLFNQFHYLYTTTKKDIFEQFHPYICYTNQPSSTSTSIQQTTCHTNRIPSSFSIPTWTRQEIFKCLIHLYTICPTNQPFSSFFTSFAPANQPIGNFHKSRTFTCTSTSTTTTTTTSGTSSSSSPSPTPSNSCSPACSTPFPTEGGRLSRVLTSREGKAWCPTAT